MNIIDVHDQIWNRQTFPDESKSSGWIQWKGTNVCMDIHCVCGHESHFDADFTYYIECPNCKKVYFCNGHIELVELTQEEAQSLDQANIKKQN